MQNAIWKLTALAGVVGIGFLVVAQAQRGLTLPESANDAQAEFVNTGEPLDVDDFENGESFAPPDAPDFGDAASFGRAEPATSNADVPFGSQPKFLTTEQTETAVRRADVADDQFEMPARPPFGGETETANSDADTFASNGGDLDFRNNNDQFPNNNSGSIDGGFPGESGANSSDDGFASPAGAETTSSDGFPQTGNSGAGFESAAAPEISAKQNFDSNPFGAVPSAAPSGTSSEAPATAAEPNPFPGGPAVMVAGEKPKQTPRSAFTSDEASSFGVAGSPRTQNAAADKPGPKLLSPNPVNSPVPHDAAASGFGDSANTFGQPNDEFGGAPSTDTEPAPAAAKQPPYQFGNDDPFGGPPQKTEPLSTPSGASTFEMPAEPQPILQREQPIGAEEESRPFGAPDVPEVGGSEAPSLSPTPDPQTFGPVESATPVEPATPETIGSAEASAQPQPDPASAWDDLPDGGNAVRLKEVPFPQNDAFQENGSQPGLQQAAQPESATGPEFRLEPLPEAQPSGQPQTRPEAGAEMNQPAATALSQEPRADETPTTVITPNPNSPPAVAIQLVPANDGELQGDGTIPADLPRGPQQPNLSIEKIAPPNAVLGKPLVYNIVVKNVGNSTASQVVVEENIPRGATLSGTIPRAELVDKRLIWKMGTLKPGEERKISVRVVPTTEGQLGSVATVNFVSEVAAATQVTAPKLHLAVNAPKQAKLGAPLVLNFKVTNQGTGEARKVILRDIIPAGLTHPGGNDLEYEVGTIAAGRTVEINLQVIATEAGTVVNRAILKFEGGVAVEESATIDIIGERLALQRSGPKRRYLRRSADFTNTVTNNSGQPARGVTVIEILPAGMEFLEASSGGQFNPAQRTVAWVVDLAPKESRQLGVKLAANAVGEQISLVSATDTNGNRVELSSHTQVEGYAALNVDVAVAEGPLDVGEQTTIRLAARNRGSAPATNVKIRLAIPAEMEFVSARGPSQHTLVGRQILFSPIASIAGGADATFEVTLRARTAADTRLQLQLESDQMRQPLSREEPILILTEAQE